MLCSSFALLPEPSRAQENDGADIVYKPFHAIAHLWIDVGGDRSHAHSVSTLHHRFRKLHDAHMNRDLWFEVRNVCKKVWATLPDDHHVAATVELHEEKIRCYAGYKAEDVHNWEHHDWTLTYLMDKEALGVAPGAYWHTEKFDTSMHEEPASEEL